MIAQSAAGLDAHGLGVVPVLQGAGTDRLAHLIEIAGLGPRELAAAVDDDDTVLQHARKSVDRRTLRIAARMGRLRATIFGFSAWVLTRSRALLPPRAPLLRRQSGGTGPGFPREAPVAIIAATSVRDSIK
jgi:hypothetical protein